jgi:hypothetical protein
MRVLTEFLRLRQHRQDFLRGQPEQHREFNMAKRNPSLYRAIHHLRKGGLHRALGVPESESIPAEKLEAAKHSENSHVQHMANFAATMKGV